MSTLTIEVQPRQETGKNNNRRLRAQGMLPAVVYGGGREPVPIQLDRKTLLELMRSTEGHNPVFLLKLGQTGKSRHAMIRELQIDPVSRRVLHVDFLRVLMTEAVRAKVHVELVGVPEGVKNEAGMLDFVTREVEVECLPDRIPAKLELDVSALHTGEHLEAGSLVMPEGVTLVEEPTRVIASVAHSRLQLEEEEVEAEELLAAEEEEPEVIGKGRAEEAEEEKEEEGA
jgi:large subunit ribosomal protein L25